MVRTAIVAALVVATLGCGSAQAGDKLGAVLGGAAVGAVGGVLLGQALANGNHPQPAPVYDAPPPRAAAVDYDDEPAPRPAVSPFDAQVSHMHMLCDRGDRHACVRFGILIGQHRERVASWRRSNPDFFDYEN